MSEPDRRRRRRRRSAAPPGCRAPGCRRRARRSPRDSRSRGRRRSASQPSATCATGSKAASMSPPDEAERVRAEHEARGPTYSTPDGQPGAAHRAPADEEAPEVREDQKPHEDEDRVHGAPLRLDSARRRPSAMLPLARSPAATASARLAAPLPCLGTPETRQRAPSRVERDEVDARALATSPAAAPTSVSSTLAGRSRGSTATSIEASGALPSTRVGCQSPSSCGTRTSQPIASSSDQLEQRDVAHPPARPPASTKSPGFEAAAGTPPGCRRRRTRGPACTRGRWPRGRDAGARERAVVGPGDERRREDERDDDHPGADEDARRAGEVAREPREVRLSARDAAEEETHEADGDAERERRRSRRRRRAGARRRCAR